MTHEDKGHFSKKHQDDRPMHPEIAVAVRREASPEGISCAAAHRVATKLNQSPKEIGFTIDRLEIPIIRCQMGLYGYPDKSRVVIPAESVSKELEERIRGALDNGRLSCADAWRIAAESGIPKMDAAAACENLGIKITACQLGAF